MIVRLASIASAGLAASVLVGTATARSTPTPLRSTVVDSAVDRAPNAASNTAPNFEVLDQLLDALRVLQSDYFEPWLGTWPQAIDWTAAVTGTYVAGALSTLSTLSSGLAPEDDIRAKENLITTYFSQLLSYYFGQDAFAIRNEAFDDMLWVVLGWLELIEFIDYHTAANFPAVDAAGATAAIPSPSRDVAEILRNQTWYGNVWTPAFSHRARIFWDLASRGWNTSLCDGGMLWNPRLEPYKNSITNELFIAASASMYLYFPGDPNPSPFTNALDSRAEVPVAGQEKGSRSPHEEKHLQSARDGYDWLTHSGMINRQGLYTDGFHIRDWNNVTNPNTKCDVRNDMVYTYNQGVLLTGQIGLWKATGDERFLRDGHALIRSVIAATGYDLALDAPIDKIADLKPGQLPPWRGLGRAGVLEEQCDVTGECSQDSQTFKGIYFHHLTAFCAPLDQAVATGEGKDTSSSKERDAAKLAFHREACASYVGWVRLNAVAAVATKDADGHFGMWWTAGLLQIPVAAVATAAVPPSSSDSHSVDYRTFGVPEDWMPTRAHAGPGLADFGDAEQVPLTKPDSYDKASNKRINKPANKGGLATEPDQASEPATRMLAGDESDPNLRGRGRTVETQGGGLAVLRALWEISRITSAP